MDFSLCKKFKCMFKDCYNLENLDVSHFNTKNSNNFEQMFCGCRKLKNIDVSKFNSSKCESINSMFMNCENLCEIDMINWDMRNLYCENKSGIFSRLFKSKIQSIDYLFYGCKKLKLIKMSSNFLDINNLISEKDNNQIFIGLPPGGTFYWKKGVNCDLLLSQLPVSWNRVME